MLSNKCHNILVVDDSKLIRVEAKKILQSFGYTADTANGGYEGIAKILKDKPDLVLLDIEMPDLSGQEVFRRIRSKAEFKITPCFIFFSTRSDKKMESLKHGASDFISKSLAKEDPDEFYSRIHAHLKIASLMKKNLELEKLAIIKAAGTSARHEIFQPLTVVNIGIGTVLSRKDLLPRCETCVAALTSAQIATKKIKNIVHDFHNIKSTKTIELSGGGRVLSRSKYK